MKKYKTATKNRKKLEKKSKLAKKSYKTWKTLGNPRVLPSRTRKKYSIYYNMKKGGKQTKKKKKKGGVPRTGTIVGSTPGTPRRSSRLMRHPAIGNYTSVTMSSIQKPKLKRHPAIGNYTSVKMKKPRGGRKYTQKKKKGGKKPCWDKYKMVGMKNKNGKRVPNCVYKK